tara:strand:+ start:1849 stop:2880 length:1032 start_codon:yes stop_codon:yes gene_type:complete
MKIIVKNRSGQDMSHMGPYLKSFLPYVQKRMGFNRPPTIFFDSDPQNAENVLGKTAYYNPETEEIVVFVDKRHPKDILRSLSHELVHHSQNCRGDLNPEIAGETTPGYAQTNAHMRAMEGEAYLKGNGYYFRDWEDSLKNGLEETNYRHITGDSHKMATYEQLKEEITKKVVAALTEKLNNNVEEAAKPDFLDIDGDGDKEEPMKKAAKEKELKEEEEELEERKKRDTPRDSDRREADKLKINEEEEELDEYMAMTSSDYGPDMPEFGGHGLTPAERQAQYEKAKKEKEEEEKRKAAFNSARFQGENKELEEAEEEKVVEEAISNDQWYQSELFESLKKRWTK